jgi:TRAP-type C4-dicarboxylate transport system permease small subunit
MSNQDHQELTSSRLDKLAAGCEWLAIGALVGIAIVQLWQVLARYVLNQSLAWSEPLSSLLLISLMSFAAASAVHQARHFRFSWLAEQAGPRAQRWLQRSGAVLVAGLCFTLSIKAWLLGLDGAQVKLPGIGIPVGSYYFPLAFAMSLAGVFAGAQVRINPSNS